MPANSRWDLIHCFKGLTWKLITLKPKFCCYKSNKMFSLENWTVPFHLTFLTSPFSLWIYRHKHFIVCFFSFLFVIYIAANKIRFNWEIKFCTLLEGTILIEARGDGCQDLSITSYQTTRASHKNICKYLFWYFGQFNP